jgi:hypothetical protein
VCTPAQYGARVFALTWPDWLDQDRLQTVALGVLVGLGVGVLLALWLAKKVITKVILIVLLVGVGFVVYNQREELATCASTCECTFFEVDVALPSAANDACEAVNAG